MSTVSVTPSRPGGMTGTVVVATTVSSCRCRSRKFVPTMFQWACLPCRCSSIRSTSTFCRSSNKLVGAWNGRISSASRRLADSEVVMADSFEFACWRRLFGPGVVEDDVDEVVADERGVEVLEHIVVHRAEGAVRAVLHPIVERRQ